MQRNNRMNHDHGLPYRDDNYDMVANLDRLINLMNREMKLIQQFKKEYIKLHLRS